MTPMERELKTFFYGATTIEGIAVAPAIFALENGVAVKIFINLQLAGHLESALQKMMAVLAIDPKAAQLLASRRRIQKSREDFNPNSLLDSGGFMTAVSAQVNFHTDNATLTFTNADGRTQSMLIMKPMVAELLDETKKLYQALVQLHAQRQTRH